MMPSTPESCVLPGVQRPPYPAAVPTATAAVPPPPARAGAIRRRGAAIGWTLGSQGRPDPQCRHSGLDRAARRRGDAAAKGRADAVISTQAPFFLQNNTIIAQLALKHRLPSLSGEPGAAEAGALVVYGPSIVEGCHRAAHCIDQILKGAKPSNLPVEQPTRFELVINLKPAKTLDLPPPQALQLRADRLIQ